MKSLTWMTICGPAAALSLTAAGLAGPAPEDGKAGLQARLARLEAEVARLIAADQAWMTEHRAEEVRALVQDVLADADTRASLLQSGLSAGYDGGFFIGNADGTFALKMNGQLQVRFVYNSQDESPVDDHRWGFENRRTKIKFKGHVVDPSWKYTVNGAFSRSSGTYAIEDAFITKTLDGGWSVRAGQFKPPFMREELVSSSRQLAVERSLMNEEFNQDRSQGIELTHKSDSVRFQAMYGDGFKRKSDPWSTEDTEFAFTARGEWLAAGDWKAFKDMSGWPGGAFAALVGGAVHYQVDEYGTVSRDEVRLLTLTADVSLEFDGASVFAAVVYRNPDSDAASPDQYGIVVQAGYFLDDEWELFGRYEWGDFDTAGVEDLSVLTMGVNRYLSKHTLKWTTDVGVAFDEISSPWASDSAGWRTDGSGRDGQVVVRSQLQLLF